MDEIIHVVTRCCVLAKISIQPDSDQEPLTEEILFPLQMNLRARKVVGWPSV